MTARRRIATLREFPSLPPAQCYSWLVNEIVMATITAGPALLAPLLAPPLVAAPPSPAPLPARPVCPTVRSSVAPGCLPHTPPARGHQQTHPGHTGWTHELAGGGEGGGCSKRDEQHDDCYRRVTAMARGRVSIVWLYAGVMFVIAWD